jgi:putative DNA primase/helicase
MEVVMEARPQPTLEEIFLQPVEPQPTPEDADALNQMDGGFPLTDAGNGERFVAERGDNIRYLNDDRCWRIWDGSRWNTDKTAEIARLAKRTIREIMREAADAESLERRERLAKWSLGCEARSRLENMVVLAAREEKVSVNSSLFDQSPWLFNCANGTIDLETNTFQPARREDYLSKQSPVIYDPTTTCPRFESFLAEILPSPDIRKFLQTSLGYTLSGLNCEKYIWFLIGESGDNGKTTFIETIRYVFGEDYAANMNFNSLLPREGQGPSGDIARLRGVRFASASESDKGQRLSPAMLKRQTGGDKLTARQLFRDEIEFNPTHKIWLATNNPPQLPADEDSLWNRIRRVPFDVRVHPDKQDRGLREKLKTEAQGILNWMFEGWKIYRQEGIKLPTEVEIETSRYRDASDVIKEFLDERVVKGPEAIGSTKLYLAYKDWFAQTHDYRQQPISQKKFSNRLEQLGYPVERRMTGSFFCGIGCLFGQNNQEDLEIFG